MTENGVKLPHSALLFMAAVEEARLSAQGPFRAIAPLFRIALEPQRGQFLNVTQVTANLEPLLGNNFTEHALEAFVPQLVKMGWLVEERAGDGKAAYRVPNNLQSFDEHEATEGSLKKLERLYSAFIDFLEVHAPLLKLTLTAEEFHWKLFKWATSLDGSNKEKVKAEAEKLLSGSKPSIRDAFLDEPQRLNEIDRTLSVEFAGFTKWLAMHGRPELADVASLTELGLAVEFLEELQRPSANQTLKVATTFVLDAPVLLDLLGLSGPAREDSIKRCLHALTDHGAHVVTLAHCLDELSDILSTVLDRPEGRRYGLTGDAMRANPALVRRATAVARQPDQAAKLAHVEVLVFDRSSPLNSSYFSDEMIDAFRKAASWHDIYKTEQRERDAMSIAFVMRRRQGRAHSEVFETPFVLITRNSTFTRFAERFSKANLSAPDYAFGPAIETKTLAAIVWIRFGSAAGPDLPQAHLISACDRILASNGELLRKAEARLKDLQGEDGANALLSSQQAVLDLVISTGGSPDVLSAANADELLHTFTTTAEERGRLDERKRSEAEKSKIEQDLLESRRNFETLSAKQIKEEELRNAVEVELHRRHESDRQRIVDAASSITERAEVSSYRIVVFLWTISTAAALFGQFFVWQGTSWWSQSKINFVTGLIIVLATVLAGAFGLRFLSRGRVDLAGALQSSLTRRVARRRLRAVEPVEERNRICTELEERGVL